MRNLKRRIGALIERARILGLSDTDVKNAAEALDYFELEVAFDTVVTQLYEYEIKVDLEFLRQVDEICDEMGIGKDKYSFLIELLQTGR